jgi:hypothetical protein
VEKGEEAGIDQPGEDKEVFGSDDDVFYYNHTSSNIMEDRQGELLYVLIEFV